MDLILTYFSVLIGYVLCLMAFDYFILRGGK